MGDRTMPDSVVKALAEVDAAHRAFLDAQGPFDRARDAYSAAQDDRSDYEHISAEDVKRLVLARRRTWAEFEAVMGPHDRAKTALCAAVGRAHDAFRDAYLPKW